MYHAKALSPLPQVNEREVSRIGRWLASPLRASLGKLDHALAIPFTIAQAIGTYYLRTIARAHTIATSGIGPTRTSGDVRFFAAVGGRTDLMPANPAIDSTLRFIIRRNLSRSAIRSRAQDEAPTQSTAQNTGNMHRASK